MPTNGQNGHELSRIIDEDDDDANVQEDHWSLDHICAYKTTRMVRMRDVHTGVLYWILTGAVVVYMVFFALGAHCLHQYQDAGIGTSITTLQTKVAFKGKAYDEADLSFPAAEPFGTFLATRLVSVKGQTVGQCKDFTQPCNAQSGAPGSQFCQRSAWCPSIGDGNAATPPPEAEIIRPDGLDKTQLNIASGIAFPGIGNHFFVAGVSEGATNPFSNLTVASLLSQARPPVKFADVRDTGALIGVSFLWNCDVVSDCEPAVSVRRLDRGTGFSQHRSREYTGDDGKSKRDALFAYGLRILVDSSGTGHRVSVALMFAQLGSGLALLRLAAWITDFSMLHLYPKARRKRYKQFKRVETKDYSDLRDRLNLVNDEGRGLLGGAQDDGGSLTMGVGGQGGLGADVLRGRAGR